MLTLELINWKSLILKTISNLLKTFLLTFNRQVPTNWTDRIPAAGIRTEKLSQ